MPAPEAGALPLGDSPMLFRLYRIVGALPLARPIRMTDRSDGATPQDEEMLAYSLQILTSAAAYRQAQQALKISEELTFSDEEINQFLPEDLWIHSKKADGNKAS